MPTVYGLPEDLKSYRAPLGAFQLIESEAGGAILAVLVVIAWIFT